MGYAVVDAIDDVDLLEIGRAVANLPLVTAGSGLALGLAQNFPEIAAVGTRVVANSLPQVNGPAAILSGSCSTVTIRQVDRARATFPSFRVVPGAIARGEDVASAALEWAVGRLCDTPILIYSTATPAEVGAVQSELGSGPAGSMVEDTLARIAAGLAERGVRRMIVAGGETSGAVVKALGADVLRIGPEIDAGVPWTVTEGRPIQIALALKSGNFGNPDFFLNAWQHLR